MTRSRCRPPLAAITISGALAPPGSPAAVDGTNSGTVFTIGSGSTVDLDHLTIENGSSMIRSPSRHGGGIINDGILTMTNSTISGNTASTGGGITNNGTISVTESTISDNRAMGPSNGGPKSAGGGIYNNGTLTVTNSTISDNMATESSSQVLGGGIYNNSNGSLTVTDSTISGNTSSGFGAGIYSQGTGLTVNGSTISDNTASSSGAGIVNSASSGVIAAITDSTISDNTTTHGAPGIWNDSVGTLNVTDSTISGNNGGTTNVGGGISNSGGAFNVTDSTISGNTDLEGAGIFGSGTVTVTGSTITNNTATEGGAIFNSSGVFTIAASTISENGGGAGISTSNSAGPPTTTLAATIVATNAGGNCAGSGFASAGYNLTDDSATGNTCDLIQPTDVLNANPMLGPLASNGGSTETMLPVTSSPVVGMIPNDTTVNTVALCGNGAKDQRGVPRPFPPATACAIGATEAVVGVSPQFTSANSTDFSTGMAETFTVTTSGVPTPSLIETGALPAGVTFADNGNGTASIAGTPAANTQDIYPLDISADDGVSPPATQTFTLTVNQTLTPPSFTADSPQTSATVGTAYTYTFAATGNPAPTFAVASGALPPGFNLNCCDRGPVRHAHHCRVVQVRGRGHERNGSQHAQPPDNYHRHCPTSRLRQAPRIRR